MQEHGMVPVERIMGRIRLSKSTSLSGGPK
jgi:hypothetical protein